MTPMPSLRLTEDEARDIASYLMTRKHDECHLCQDASFHGRSESEESRAWRWFATTAAPAAMRSPGWKKSSASAPN